MQVTRRELMTAASAVGLTAALTQTTEGAENAAKVSHAWAEVDDVPHYKQCVKLIKRTDPERYRDYSDNILTTWKAAAPQDKSRVVRGLYRGSVAVKENLRLVYAFEYRPRETQPNDEFTLYVLGGLFGGPNPIRRIKNALTKIQEDLIADQGTSVPKYFIKPTHEAVFERIGLKASKPGSQFGRIVRLIRCERHRKFRIEKDDTPLPVTWSLTVLQ